MALPHLKRQRLLLRSLEVSDEIQLATLLGDKQIADTTANIPYLMEMEMEMEMEGV